MDTGLTAILLGLGAALLWGVNDFMGGFASRQGSAFGVVILSQVTGLLVLAVLITLSSEPILTPQNGLLACVAGVMGGVGLVLFYRAMARGQMAVVTSVAAVLMAGVPITFGIATEGLPGILQVIGFGIAILGIWLVTRSHEAAGKFRLDVLVLVAGATFGLFIILIDRIGESATFWPLVFTRIAGALLLGSIAFSRYRDWTWLPNRSVLPLVLVMGALDTGGTALFVIATQTGRLDIAAVLASLYPAVTVLLARLLLKEQLTRWQVTGIAAVLTAIVLIAL